MSRPENTHPLAERAERLTMDGPEMAYLRIPSPSGGALDSRVAENGLWHQFRHLITAASRPQSPDHLIEVTVVLEVVNRESDGDFELP